MRSGSTIRLEPLGEAHRRRAVGVIHDRLRSLILEGGVAPGRTISQKEVAEALGVSRTPVREAFRLLQQEGLLRLIADRRAVVAPFEASEVDALYASRIMLECLAITITVGQLDEVRRRELGELLVTMDDLVGKLNAWEEKHRAFHDLLVSGAAEPLRNAIRQAAEQSERYRRLYAQAEPRAWSIGAGEHRTIRDAVVRNDAVAAAIALATHYARTALTLLANLTPAYEPASIRTALRLVTGSTGIERSDATAGPVTAPAASVRT